MVTFAIPDSVTGKDIKIIRKKLELTQAEFANLANISKKTVERWETERKPITGSIVTLVKILSEYPQMGEELVIPDKTCPLRLLYMSENNLCTIIDVDERYRRVKIYNYTRDCMSRAFGREEHPTFEQYEEFLESRCFPRSRDRKSVV